MSPKQIAKLLLQINAIKLKPETPFTWSSGKKSPIYCDNRLILSYPEIRQNIAETLTAYAQQEFKKTEIIAGVATAGIPHGVLIAHTMNLPFVYVRSSEKKHGRKNKIEGELGQNKKVLIIEDLISTGKSSLHVANTLKNYGCEILGILSIFNYNFITTKEMFKQEKMKIFSLCNFNDLIIVGEEENYISKNQLTIIKDWHVNFYSKN